MVMMYFQAMECLFSFSVSIALRESPGSEELVRMSLSVSCFTPSSLPIFSHFCFAALSSCTSNSNSVTKGTKEVGIQTILANVCTVISTQITCAVVNGGGSINTPPSQLYSSTTLAVCSLKFRISSTKVHNSLSCNYYN